MGKHENIKIIQIIYLVGKDKRLECAEVLVGSDGTFEGQSNSLTYVYGKLKEDGEISFAEISPLYTFNCYLGVKCNEQIIGICEDRYDNSEDIKQIRDDETVEIEIKNIDDYDKYYEWIKDGLRELKSLFNRQDNKYYKNRCEWYKENLDLVNYELYGKIKNNLNLRLMNNFSGSLK